MKVVSKFDTSKELTMSIDILEFEMQSGNTYDTEEKVTRTEMVNILLDAKECVFTAGFHTKVDDKYVLEILNQILADGKSLTDAKTAKEVAKDLTSGKLTEITCYLLKTDFKLGRSSVIDLNSPSGINFR